MPTDISTFIKNLQKSKLFAECPYCGQEFSLSKATLFDGRKKFPEIAENKRLEWKKELDERLVDLKERKMRATTGAEKTAISVGIGKIIEKILPAYKNFNMTTADCRFLAEPIDMIVFDGVSKLKIKHITFMEVKTGNARLNTHQRVIRDAINDHNVRHEVI